MAGYWLDNKLLDISNGLNDAIKFTIEKPNTDNQLPFLDTLVTTTIPGHISHYVKSRQCSNRMVIPKDLFKRLSDGH